MPTRRDLRHSNNSKLVWLGIIVGVIIVVGVGFLIYAYSGSGGSSSPTHSESKSTKTVGTAAKSSSANSELKQQLIGLGFRIMPTQYNGEAVNAAMDANRAPQNLVHDGSKIGYFKTATTARVSGISAYFYVGSLTYHVTGKYLFLLNRRIPIEVQGGAVATQEWRETDATGNEITWQISAYQEAVETVESHVPPRTTENDDDSVDPLNLTSAQLEHWVRSVIKSGSQVYHASEDTFSQQFVDGYAEIQEIVKDPNTGHSEVRATYRVNSSGYLEMQDDTNKNVWKVVSKQYY